MKQTSRILASWMNALAEAVCLESGDQLERIVRELEVVSQACRTTALRDQLQTLNAHDAYTLIEQAWKTSLSEHSLRVIRLLLDRHALNGLSVFNQRLRTTCERHGFYRVRVTTYEALHATDQQQLIKHLERVLQGNVFLESVLDPHVLGGMRLESERWFFDTTVQQQLKQLRETLLRPATT